MARATGARDFFRTYTSDLTRADVHRLFTRETREAWRFYARGMDERSLAAMPPLRRAVETLRALFVAFSLKLSPARRVVYAASLVLTVVGLFELFEGFGIRWIPAGILSVPMVLPLWRDGTILVLGGFVLVNLLILLEVADRLTLKNDLEVARDIQQAMLPQQTFRAAGVETHGATRPANTVGGDFYDIQPLSDGRVVVALGDVAGKGSPAALLMALLLAMMRTLLDEGLEAAALAERLNLQIYRHAPRSRFITLFLAFFDPATGTLTYVNAGQTPPLLRRTDGQILRLSDSGVALGLTDRAGYRTGTTVLAPGDVAVLYSDGVTEAENADGVPFDEAGLEAAIASRPDATAPDLGGSIIGCVERHAGDTRFADDLTVVVLRRLPPVPAA